MKFILIVVLTAGAQWFLPWWSIMAIAFLVGFGLPASGINSFLAGFLGVGFLWAGYAYWIDQETASILTNKITALFQLQSNALLILLTGVVGGLAAGFGALSGTLFRKIFQRQKRSSNYYY